MSLQKEIKYAINSTVGTPAFEPLSEMIHTNGIRFTSSQESIYYNFGAGQANKKMIAFGTGSMIIFAIKRSTTTELTSNLKVYKNGEQVTTSASGPSSSGYVYLTCNLQNISLGDEIEIVYTGDGILKIGADVKDQENLIKIEA